MTKFQLDDASWNQIGQNTELLHESSWSVSNVILHTIEPQVNLGYTSRCLFTESWAFKKTKPDNSGNAL